jgi:hypothetical protein
MTTPAATGAQPHVLFIDDDDRISPALLDQALRGYDLSVRLRHPEEAFADDLAWADLVVIDYFLTHWAERDETDSVARSPKDGLAVAATMRSTLLPSLADRYPGAVLQRPVAFAVWSGHLSEASFGLPDVVLPHVFSRENNLEWVFRREALFAPEGGIQLSALAKAVTSLPEHWSNQVGEPERQLWQLLRLDSGAAPWAPEAEAEVLDCRPQLHELSERSHGLVLLRWLLHRIFPYPCFLLDEQQLCARLRVDALTGGDAETTDLRAELLPYEYTGALQGFPGLRWWRAGVEDWLFRMTNGDAGNSRAVAALAVRHGARAEREWLHPVTVIAGDLRRVDRLVEVEETVRIRPDDWPPYADDAFALRSDAEEDPGLRALVQPADRFLLDGRAWTGRA